MTAILSDSTLIGEKVVNRGGEDLGKLQHVVVPLETGPRGIRPALRPLQWQENPPRRHKGNLDSAEGFDQDSWPNWVDPAFRMHTFCHFSTDAWASMTRKHLGLFALALAALLGLALVVAEHRGTGQSQVSMSISSPTDGSLPPGIRGQGASKSARFLSNFPNVGGSKRAELEYTVQPGDTVSAISGIFDVPVTSLMVLNDVSNADVIAPGTRLTIPLSLESSAAEEPAATAAELPGVAQELREAEVAHALPHGMLLAVAWRESRWDQSAVSSAGAVGVAQVLPSTAEWTEESLLGQELDWRGSAGDNAQVGAAYLRYLLDRADGDVWKALAAYYQGWRSLSERGPAPDTVRYVRDVLRLVPSFQ